MLFAALRATTTQLKKELWLYVASASSGILVWIVVSAVSGKSEAWDSSWYFVAGYPFLCAGSMALGFIAPVRSWRWGLIPFAAQFLWMLLTEGPGNLMPLGIVMFGVFSLPAIVAARVGAFFGTSRANSEP